MLVIFQGFNIVTLCVGCIFGISLAFIFMKTEDEFDSMHVTYKFDSKPNHYFELLAQEKLRRVKIDSDELSYGNISSSVRKEDVFLYDRIHVTCVIFAFNRKKAEVIKSTYGNHKHCNEVFYFASFNDSSLPIVVLKSKSSWHYLCQAIQYVWKLKHHSINWVLFSHDELFAIPENLRYYVASSGFKHEDDYYLGNPMTFWGQTYNSAKSGYVLSQGAMKRFESLFNATDGRTCSTGFNWRNEDFYLGKHLSQLHIVPTDTRDVFGRGRFHGYQLARLITGRVSPLEDYRKKGIYPLQEGFFTCCSNETITFRAEVPADMFLFAYLVYQVRVFYGGWRGNQPFPISQEDIWLKFMKKMNLDNMSFIQLESQTPWPERPEGY